jgi:hypothetical protein
MVLWPVDLGFWRTAVVIAVAVVADGYWVWFDVKHSGASTARYRRGERWIENDQRSAINEQRIDGGNRFGVKKD